MEMNKKLVISLAFLLFLNEKAIEIIYFLFIFTAFVKKGYWNNQFFYSFPCN